MKINGKEYTPKQLAKAKKYVRDLVMYEMDQDKPLGTDEWPDELPRAMGLKLTEEQRDNCEFWYDDIKAIVKAVLS